MLCLVDLTRLPSWLIEKVYFTDSALNSAGDQIGLFAMKLQAKREALRSPAQGAGDTLSFFMNLTDE